MQEHSLKKDKIKKNVVKILHTVYVVHQNTGCCLISENFTQNEINVDSDIISSYIVAFKSVGEEMTKGSGDLKVIDMGVYNLILIVQKDIMTIGAADKTDDKMILYYNLSKLQSIFMKRYNSQSELEYWNGELATFRDFRKVIREELEDGQIGEVKKYIPIFKIYKKQFLKRIEQENKKSLEIKEADYKVALEIEEKSPIDYDKTFPKQPIAQGFFKPYQYKIAHFLNGFHTPEDIADKLKVPVEDIYKTLKKIDDLGLLAYIELV